MLSVGSANSSRNKGMVEISLVDEENSIVNDNFSNNLDPPPIVGGAEKVRIKDRFSIKMPKAIRTVSKSGCICCSSDIFTYLQS